MICTNCGNEVPDLANVCGYCGQRLKSAASHPPTPAAPPSSPKPAVQHASVQASPPVSTPPKKGIPAWIWALGGGGLVVVLIGTCAFVFGLFNTMPQQVSVPTVESIPTSIQQLAPTERSLETLFSYDDSPNDCWQGFEPGVCSPDYIDFERFSILGDNDKLIFQFEFAGLLPNIETATDRDIYLGFALDLDRDVTTGLLDWDYWPDNRGIGPEVEVMFYPGSEVTVYVFAGGSDFDPYYSLESSLVAWSMVDSRTIEISVARSLIPITDNTIHFAGYSLFTPSDGSKTSDRLGDSGSGEGFFRIELDLP